MDEFYEQNYWKIIEEEKEYYEKLERQFSGMDEYHNENVWGGGRYNSPPF